MVLSSDITCRRLLLQRLFILQIYDSLHQYFIISYDLIFIMILMEIIFVYGSRCIQPPNISLYFSSDVGLFWSLEMVKLIFNISHFLWYTLSQIYSLFNSTKMVFDGPFLIPAPRLVYLHSLRIIWLKLMFMVVQKVNPWRPSFGGVLSRIQLVDESLVLWKVLVMVLILIMNFVLFRIGWNLFRIMDPDTSFASQILKKLSFIKDGLSPIHPYAPLIDIIIHLCWGIGMLCLFIHTLREGNSHAYWLAKLGVSLSHEFKIIITYQSPLLSYV